MGLDSKRMRSSPDQSGRMSAKSSDESEANTSSRSGIAIVARRPNTIAAPIRSTAHTVETPSRSVALVRSGFDSFSRSAILRSTISSSVPNRPSDCQNRTSQSRSSGRRAKCQRSASSIALRNCWASRDPADFSEQANPLAIELRHDHDERFLVCRCFLLWLAFTSDDSQKLLFPASVPPSRRLKRSKAISSAFQRPVAPPSRLPGRTGKCGTAPLRRGRLRRAFVRPAQT